jgi:hypothetical protein
VVFTTSSAAPSASMLYLIFSDNELQLLVAATHQPFFPDVLGIERGKPGTRLDLDLSGAFPFLFSLPSSDSDSSSSSLDCSSSSPCCEMFVLISALEASLGLLSSRTTTVPRSIVFLFPQFFEHVVAIATNTSAIAHVFFASRSALLRLWKNNGMPLRSSGFRCVAGWRGKVSGGCLLR